MSICLSVTKVYWRNNRKVHITWAPSSEFVSSSIPSWQGLTAHAQPFTEARDLAWTFAARIGDKYQIRLTRSTSSFYLNYNTNSKQQKVA